MANRRKRIKPSQVEEAAKKKEKENKRFRSFLKNRADPEVLDLQFRELHKMIFPRYDCNQCRNCCKLLAPQIPEADIDRDAAFLHMSRDEFIDKHLERTDFGEWIEKHSPCGFLTETGECSLGECCPDSCKKFPYTDQPDRLYSLYSVLDAVSICPAAYEILEALKELYDFDEYRRSLRRRHYVQEEPSAFDVDRLFLTPFDSYHYKNHIDEDDSEDLPF